MSWEEFEKILDEYTESLEAEQISIDKDIENDVQYLIDNPKSSLGSKYHDAGSCWKLIDALIIHIRKMKNGEES